jgi:hypothetical protein
VYAEEPLFAAAIPGITSTQARPSVTEARRMKAV